MKRVRNYKIGVIIIGMIQRRIEYRGLSKFTYNIHIIGSIFKWVVELFLREVVANLKCIGVGVNIYSISGIVSFCINID